jgi:hypothetical protein
MNGSLINFIILYTNIMSSTNTNINNLSSELKSCLKRSETTFAIKKTVRWYPGLEYEQPQPGTDGRSRSRTPWALKIK